VPGRDETSWVTRPGAGATTVASGSESLEAIEAAFTGAETGGGTMLLTRASGSRADAISPCTVGGGATTPAASDAVPRNVCDGTSGGGAMIGVLIDGTACIG